ncbi:MAG: copper amine oxidase N-terminal domain-containing protein [Clostridiaceae bacterium]|nr:copper amine oxidase N-terminal domain-containing protein [Clostridiaceae bacterium]
MKNIILLRNIKVIAILFAIIGSFTCIASASAVPELRVCVDEKEVQFTDAKPYINEFGRTMVPIRAIAEGFGAKVNWNDVLDMVEITHDNIEIKFKLNYYEDVLLITDLETNHIKSVAMDSKPVIKNDRTFVPYRAISEAFGYEVYWNADEYKVNINTKSKQPVFYINPALTRTQYYSCIDDMNTDFENIIPYLKSPEVTFKLTEERKQSYLYEATSHVESVIGNVDYSKEFNPTYPNAPFTSIMEFVHNDAVKNSIIREVKFIADTSKVEILSDTIIFEQVPADAIVIGRLEFIYHEASDEYLDRFKGKLKKGVWYSTNIAVKFSLQRGSMEIEKVILDNKFEEII